MTLSLHGCSSANHRTISTLQFIEQSVHGRPNTLWNFIRRRDRIYGTIVTRRLRAMGIRDKLTASASPWQNGFAERLIGSIRRECLDHFVFLGEAHLRRILPAYARYHNDIRTHRSLDKDAPVSRPRSADRNH
jgi:transposase InsO family protein